MALVAFDKLVMISETTCGSPFILCQSCRAASTKLRVRTVARVERSIEMISISFISNFRSGVGSQLKKLGGLAKGSLLIESDCDA